MFLSQAYLFLIHSTYNSSNQSLPFSLLMLTPSTPSASPFLLPTLSWLLSRVGESESCGQADDKEHEEKDWKKVQEKEGTSRSMDLVEGGGYSSSLWTNHGVRAPPLSPSFHPHHPPRLLIAARPQFLRR